MAADHPIEVMGVVQTILRGEGTGIEIYACQSELRALLEVVAKKDSREALGVLGEVVHHLGSLGFHQFRDLLEL